MKMILENKTAVLKVTTDLLLAKSSGHFLIIVAC